MNDFRIKYTTLQDAQHFLATLKQHYKAITVDWDGTLYCGITLDWNYDKLTVDLLMPDYIQTVLDDFNHVPTNRAKHQPHRHNLPQYGVKTQLTDPIDATALLVLDNFFRYEAHRDVQVLWSVQGSIQIKVGDIHGAESRFGCGEDAVEQNVCCF
jgi:hypothetical protein